MVNDQQVVIMKWIKPPSDHFKLNVDGSRTTVGVIASGGVTRNHSGNWVQGFSHHIGVGEIIEAEVWGIYIGLKMAAELQIKKLLVECDSAIVVKLLNAADISMHPLATIIGNCHSLRQLFESCLISHVHRERNNIADSMAKHGLGLPRGTTMFCSPPPQFAGMVYDDIAGVSRSRLTGLSRPCS